MLHAFRPQDSWSDFSCPVCFKRRVGTADLGSNHPCDDSWSSIRSFTFFFWEPLYWWFYQCRKWWGASTKNIPLVLNNYVWCLMSFIIVFLVFKNFEKTSHCYCSFPRVVIDSVLVEKKSFQTWLSSIELVSLSKFYMLHGRLSKIALSAGIFLWKISCCREPLQIFRSYREILQDILKQVPEFSN